MELNRINNNLFIESVLSPSLIEKKYIIKALLENYFKILDEFRQTLYLHHKFDILTDINDLFKEFEYVNKNDLKLNSSSENNYWSLYLNDDITTEKNNLLINAIKNDKVQRLNLEYIGRKISDFDFLLLFKAITNSKIEYLNLDYLYIEDAYIIPFMESLKSNVFLKYLNLSHVKISETSITILADAIKVNKNLQYLNLSHLNPHNETCRYLLKSLKENDTLKYLNLSMFPIHHMVMDDFFEFLTKNKNLEYLNLSECNWKCDEFQKLSSILKFSSIKHLNLSSSKLNTINFMILKNLLSENETLISLDLSFNNLKICISDILNNNNTLQYLDLSYNKIYIDNLPYLINNKNLKYLCMSEQFMLYNYLGVILLNNTTINHLDISKNCIEHFELYQIAESLKHNNTLLSLKLQPPGLIGINKYINDMKLLGLKETGISNLADMLKVNNTLQSLDLVYNDIDANDIMKLIESLKFNSGLQNLNLNLCSNLTDDICFILADVLRKNKTLLSLNISHCRMTIKGCVYLIESLKENKTLQVLTLISNLINNDIIAQISEVLQENKSLQYFNLMYSDIYMDHQHMLINTSLKYIQCHCIKYSISHLMVKQ